MSRTFINPQNNTEKKLSFTPRDMINEFGIGIGFNAYGKVFLFVGTVTEGSTEIPALIISDWTQGQFFQSAINHTEHPVDQNAFIPAENRYTDGRHPAYAISNPQEIINMLEQIREHQEEQKLSEALEELAEKARSQLSSLIF